jgi:hypothetical protein
MPARAPPLALSAPRASIRPEHLERAPVLLSEAGDAGTGLRLLAPVLHTLAHAPQLVAEVG